MMEPNEDKPVEKSPIERAEEAAARLEAANKRAEELARQNEELAVRNTLGGQSSAGQTPPKPKEETPAEYVDRVMKDGKDAKRA